MKQRDKNRDRGPSDFSTGTCNLYASFLLWCHCYNNYHYYWLPFIVTICQQSNIHFTHLSHSSLWKTFEKKTWSWLNNNLTKFTWLIKVNHTFEFMVFWFQILHSWPYVAPILISWVPLEKLFLIFPFDFLTFIKMKY